MRPLPLWRHEARRAGWTAPLAPPLATSVLVLVALVDQQGGDTHRAVARNLVAALEMALPLAAGIGAASLAGRDRAAEIQLTMPTAYRATLLRRLAVTVGWTALVAVPVVACLVATGWWARVPASHGPLLGQLVWAAPTLWLAAFGFLAGAACRGPAAAGGLVAVLWIVEELFAGLVQEHRWSRSLYLFATTRGSARSQWTENRLALVVTAAVLAGAGWLLLGRTERLLRGEDG